MDAQQFLNSVTALVVIGGGCALGVASLVVIAWVTWMLADAGRAVDYRHRVDAALHGGGGDRTRWLAAIRAEGAFAYRYLRHVDRRHGRHPG